MTNAEKLAKDTETLTSFLVDVYCSPLDTHCDNCPLSKINCKDFDSVQEWLEQEVKEE